MAKDDDTIQPMGHDPRLTENSVWQNRHSDHLVRVIEAEQGSVTYHSVNFPTLINMMGKQSWYECYRFVGPNFHPRPAGTVYEPPAPTWEMLSKYITKGKS